MDAALTGQSWRGESDRRRPASCHSRRVLAGLAAGQRRGIHGKRLCAAAGRLGRVPGVLLLEGQGSGVGQAGPGAARAQG